MTRLRKQSPSRDEMRAVKRQKAAEGRGSRVDVSLRPSSRRRLNELRDFLKVDDQSMAVDIAYMRITGKGLS